MKKQLRFLYRYFIASRRWRKLLNRQAALVAVASLAFLITLGWTAPRAADRETPRRPGGRVALQQTTPQPAAGTAAADTAAADTAAAPGQDVSTPGAGLVSPTPTFTPFPPEFETNADQTVGITLAGALLVLIVVIATLAVMPKKR